MAAMDIISNLMESVKRIDSKGEFKELYQDRSEWQEIFKKQKEEMDETLLLLSEYGKISPIIQKFRDFVSVERDLSQEDQEKPLQYLANISDEEMLEVYQVCYDCFNKKEYAKATKVANWLSLVNPYISAFWRMVGSSLWHQNEIQGSLAPFVCAAIMDETLVENHLAVLECLVKLGNNQEALNYYQLAKQFLTDARKDSEIPKLDAVTKNL